MIKQLDIADPVICQQVLQVQLPAYQVEAEMIGFDGIPALQDTVATLQFCGEQFYGYYQEGELAGVISFQLLEDTLDIHRLVVHPKHFRKGIGKALVQFLLEKEKVNRYIVQTGMANVAAIRLYRGFGFEEVGQLEVHQGVWITKLEKTS